MQLLSEAGITSIGDVACSDPLRIEHLLNRKSSSFGFNLVQQARNFPDLNLVMSEISHRHLNDHVESRIQISIDVKNTDKEVVGVFTSERQPRYVVCLTASSEGQVSFKPCTLFMPLIILIAEHVPSSLTIDGCRRC